MKNPLLLCRAIRKHFSTIKKVIDLEPIELEKVKADLIKELPSNDNLFFPLLDEYEKLHPGKKIIVTNRPPEELENVC